MTFRKPIKLLYLAVNVTLMIILGGCKTYIPGSEQKDVTGYLIGSEEEKEVKKYLTAMGYKVNTVKCPEQLELKGGNTFKCQVKTDKRSIVVKEKMVSVSEDIIKMEREVEKN